jgi:predicted Rossmann fold nucleotide-binding protein DprA/Smf involved in DNA uptake
MTKALTEEEKEAKAAAKATETEETKQRGRPRPDEVIARDDAVLNAVTDEPKSTQDLVEATSLARNLVYLSLFRLRRDGRVQRAKDEAGAQTRHWVRA